MATTKLWTNANIATCDTALGDLGIHHDATLVVVDDRVEYVGPTDQLPTTLQSLLADASDLDGAWITPGLIDCHTHIIFGGDRSTEFELRLKGASYAELQAAGGGIFGTVEATHSASDQQLYDTALARLESLGRSGATTVEIKSGYGLTVDQEIRMLHVAKRLKEHPASPDVVPTCLAAHALPAEYNNDREGYIQLMCQQLLPKVAKLNLATSVDAFGESIAFTREEIYQVFTTAKQLGLSVKLHADQLSDQNGAALAAEFNALSADHLEYTSERGVRAMAAADTVAVLLPGAFYNLRENQLPPIEEFRQHQVAMAIATDANPGSSPMLSLPLAMNMACVLFGMTINESILGVTRHAATALGLSDRGQLKPGFKADFCIWAVDKLAEIIYWTGANRLPQVVQHGQLRS